MGYTITYDEGSYELAVDGLEVWVGTKAECEAKAIELNEIMDQDGTMAPAITYLVRSQNND